MTVSRNDHLPKVVDPTKAREVGLAVIRIETSTGTSINAGSCSCNGWVKVHRRLKVVEDAAQRHLDKKHNGRGLWM